MEVAWLTIKVIVEGDAVVLDVELTQLLMLHSMQTDFPFPEGAKVLVNDEEYATITYKWD